jgi:hypothetical protein
VASALCTLISLLSLLLIKVCLKMKGPGEYPGFDTSLPQGMNVALVAVSLPAGLHAIEIDFASGPPPPSGFSPLLLLQFKVRDLNLS